MKYNLITSDIKLVSYSSTITMMHGPIYIRFTVVLFGCCLMCQGGKKELLRAYIFIVLMCFEF